MLGQHLLQKGDSQGEGLLMEILERDEDECVPAAFDSLAMYYQLSGDTERLQEIKKRHDRFEEAMEASHQERSIVLASDTFLPHELPADELYDLRAQLEAIDNLSQAWLVRKKLDHFPHKKLFVLCVRSKTNLFGSSKMAADLAMSQRLVGKLDLPGRVLVITPQAGFKPLAKKIMTQASARVVDR